MLLRCCNKECGKAVWGVIDVPESYDMQGVVNSVVEDGMFKIFINANMRVDENGEADIFADVYRHIVRREHKEHNQPQQQQHQCRTDTGRYELHIEQ